MLSSNSTPKMSLKAGRIDLATFMSYLEKYPEHVPEKLGELEEFRMHKLPATLQQRKQESKDICVTKDELVKLVEWKL